MPPTGRRPARHRADAAAATDAAQPSDATLPADGVQALFDDARPDCPLCGGRALRELLRTRDLLQYKPGEFCLQRCGGCGHVFQNPMLSARGLAYYYADFYDGLGEASVAQRFAAQRTLDRQRARLVPLRARPERWLDVGAGHGHFCREARRRFDRTRFDALDRNPALAAARSRGWIDRAIGVELVAHARAHGPLYDVISMFHYLEHTRDPRAELAAAAHLLRPGGLLLVESPDPESALGHLLGRYWLSWFQPQHLHLLSLTNLRRLLEEAGLRVDQEERGRAHRPEDLQAAVKLLLGDLAPAPDRPWHAASPHDERQRAAVGLAGLPLLLGAGVADRLLAPLLRRAGLSNTYRVLARRPHGEERA
jgi:SAM-dependent methyltransferase